MKFKLILPALAGLILTQFAPQAAWSWDHCRDGYMPPREVRRIMRHERYEYRYGAPYGYAPAPCYYHGGLLSTVGRVIF